MCRHVWTPHAIDDGEYCYRCAKCHLRMHTSIRIHFPKAGGCRHTWTHLDVSKLGPLYEGQQCEKCGKKKAWMI